MHHFLFIQLTMKPIPEESISHEQVLEKEELMHPRLLVLLGHLYGSLSHKQKQRCNFNSTMVKEAMERLANKGVGALEVQVYRSIERTAYIKKIPLDDEDLTEWGLTREDYINRSQMRSSVVTDSTRIFWQGVSDNLRNYTEILDGLRNNRT